ncbi:MAG: EamA family transporter, partial [Flavobacteriaceae bacterium]|nr:EamA family transporter [Flavobacteriaceae bacterium]
FIAVIEVMKSITPYTVVLTYNLEPVDGIVLAIMLFPASEIMGLEFYIGAVIILAVVFLNSLLTRQKTVHA